MPAIAKIIHYINRYVDIDRYGVVPVLHIIHILAHIPYFLPPMQVSWWAEIREYHARLTLALQCWDTYSHVLDIQCNCNRFCMGLVMTSLTVLYTQT